MDHAPAEASYRSYWIAWLVLLGITLFMVLTGSRGVLIAGMGLKAGIIALWFMHLKYERLDFGLIIALAVLLTAAALFVLIAPDGSAM